MGTGKGRNKRVNIKFQAHVEVMEVPFDPNKPRRKGPEQVLSDFLGDSDRHQVYVLPSKVRVERLGYGDYRVYDYDGQLAREIKSITANQEAARLAMRLHRIPTPE